MGVSYDLSPYEYIDALKENGKTERNPGINTEFD